jgi:hypothetical protein
MSSQEELNQKVRKASEVQSKYANQLMSKPHVVGVAIGHPTRNGVKSSDVGLIVMVDRKVPANQLSPSDLIPNQLDGIPVDVQETGGFSAQ